MERADYLEALASQLQRVQQLRSRADHMALSLHAQPIDMPMNARRHLEEAQSELRDAESEIDHMYAKLHKGDTPGLWSTHCDGIGRMLSRARSSLDKALV